MEGQIILNTIAQHIDMELLSREPVGLEPVITLRPKGGIAVKVRRLN